MNKHIIVLDIGTTTAKATVFTTSGRTVSFASLPYGFLKREPGRFEQDPDEVYDSVLESARMAISEAAEKERHLDPQVIATVCQGGSLLPCDKAGKALRPMITWMDQRAADIAVKLGAGSAEQNGGLSGQQILEHTGRIAYPDMPLCMILWLRGHDPQLYSSVSRWMNLNDYVTARLTGQFITDPSSAVMTQLFNVYTETWDPDLLAMAGISPDQLSEILPCGADCGGLLPEAAVSMGLPAGIPVLNSMHDRTAEAMGLGNFRTGDSWIGTGTAWVACAVTEKGAGDRTGYNFHALDGKAIRSKLVGGIGSSVEWWIKVLTERYNLPGRAEAFRLMTDLAVQSVPGCHGLFFKAFTGSGNRGEFVSISDNLDPAIDSPDFTDADRCRAVYESIAFDFKKEYLPFSSLIPKGGKLTLVGGASRSSYWPDIIAAILGSGIEVSSYEHDATLGGAVTAGRYLNLAPDLPGVFDIFKVQRRALVPSPADVAAYEDLYQQYLRSL